MILDQINQMRRQGMLTSQIVQNLRQQGVSSKEINEALSQSEIKDEIISSTISTKLDDMQPSISSQENYNEYTKDNKNYNYPTQNQQNVLQPYAQGYSEPQTQEYPQYNSYQEGDYSYPEYEQKGGTDIETINDISSQIVEEKIKHFKKEFSNFLNFKKEFESKVENIEKRLTKIEEKFEQIQMAIIRKIGDYGEDIENLSKEIKSTQDSFSKVIDPLTEKAKEIKSKEDKNKTKNKKEDSFENYLR